MLEILRQKTGSNIEVVQRYKFQDNSVPLSLRNVPPLLNDNVYEASHTDINQVNFTQGIHIVFIFLLFK